MSKWWEDEIHVGPALDGTAALDHDGFDLDTWAGLGKSAPRLNRSIAAQQAAIPTLPDLARDTFISLFRTEPGVHPPAPLLPSHQPHQKIMDALLENETWRHLHEKTKSDSLMSVMGTIGMVPGLVQSLDQPTKNWMARQENRERQHQNLRESAAVLREMADQGGDKQEDLSHAADEWEARAQAIADQAGDDPSPPTPIDLGQIEQAAQAAAQGTAALAAAINLTGGTGIGSELGHPGLGMALADKLALAQVLLNNPKLADIARMAGRMARVARSIHDPRVVHSPEVFKEIASGHDLSHLAGSELSRLADPDLEDLFWTRYADQALAIKVLEGVETAGRGPLIIALDSSGSMGGTKEVWSKAATLVLLTIAKEERRDVRLLHFSSGPVKEKEFRAGEATIAELTKELEYFENGGTEYQPWMNRALRIVDEARWDKADVVLISDGLAHISDEMKAQWKERRTERGMRCLGILLGVEDTQENPHRQGSRQIFEGITDHLVCLDDDVDVGNSLPALEKIFTL